MEYAACQNLSPLEAKSCTECGHDLAEKDVDQASLVEDVMFENKGTLGSYTIGVNEAGSSGDSNGSQFSQINGMKIVNTGRIGQLTIGANVKGNACNLRDLGSYSCTAPSLSEKDVLFSELKIKMDDELTEENLVKICTLFDFKPGEKEKINTGILLMDKLESKDIISPDNVSRLIEVLKFVKLNRCAKIVECYEDNRKISVENPKNS